MPAPFPPVAELTGECREDFDIVEKVLKGDRALFEILVKKYQDRIFRSAFFYTRHPDDAKDLAQDVFIKAYRDLARFRKQSSFFTWLFWILKDYSSRYYRKKSRTMEMKALPEEDTGLRGTVPVEQRRSHEDVEGLSDLEMKRETVRSAVHSLKEKYRNAVVLYYFEGFSYNETAKVLKCSETAVKARLFRAREMLKGILGKAG